MKRITLIFGLLLLASLAVVAQIRGNEIVVQVQPQPRRLELSAGRRGHFQRGSIKERLSVAASEGGHRGGSRDVCRC